MIKSEKPDMTVKYLESRIFALNIEKQYYKNMVFML